MQPVTIEEFIATAALFTPFLVMILWGFLR
jgi:hypothetical protein